MKISRMPFASGYFKKHTYFIPELKEPPPGLLWCIVVIPVYREEDLISVLETIRGNLPPEEFEVEVLLIFNHPENDTEQNKRINAGYFNEAEHWIVHNQLPWLKFHAFWVPDLPKKNAGAGLARKIGMDLALKRFDTLNRPGGLIMSLDADTRIERNYFREIYSRMKLHPGAGGCIVNFAHPLREHTYGDEIYRAIVAYELHLRYYRHILGFIGFPWANYTIGSCFGVRAGVYARSGGMNRRKAGEDFYFLNKLLPHYHFAEVKDTCVYPSPRTSDRVIFGTGPVIARMLASGQHTIFTYDPESFFELKKLFDKADEVWFLKSEDHANFLSRLSPAVRDFLTLQNFKERIREIQANTARAETFRKRFFLWFDGFKVVKYLNFAHEHYYARKEVTEAVMAFLSVTGHDIRGIESLEILKLLREWDQIPDQPTGWPMI